QLIARNIHTCRADTFEIMFRTIPNPVAAFVMNTDSGCTPLAVNFTNTSSVGTSSQWIFGNGNTSTTTSPSQTYINTSHIIDSVFIIKLIVTAGGTGCRDSIFDTVRVFPRPLSRFSISQPVACPVLTLTTSNTSLAKVPAQSRWAVLNSVQVTLNDTTVATPTVSLPDNQSNADSTYTLRLRTISVNGCVHDTTGIFTRLRRPLVQYTIPPSACGPFSFTPVNSTNNIADANLSWNWTINPTAGTSIVTAAVKAPVVSLPVNTNNDSLIYTLRTTATRNDGGCIDTLSRRITVYPKPAVAFTAVPDTGCTPLTVNYTNTSNARNGDSINTMTFDWRLNGNSFATSQNIIPQTYTNPVQRDSVLAMRLIGTTQHGCKDTANRNITVYPRPRALFSATDSVSCAPYLITPSKITLTQFPLANDTYKWRVLNGSRVPIDSVLGITPPSRTIPNPLDTLIYQLIVTNVHGCRPDTMSILFRTIANPIAAFSMVDSVGCTPLRTQFFNTGTTGAIYRWTFSNGVNSRAQDTAVVFTNSSHTADQVFTAKLVVTAGTGCSDSIQKNITVFPRPLSRFTISQPIA
ncbi:MAG: hypothetical protein ACK5HJ_05065, partial [Bacteroidota bacterium]